MCVRGVADGEPENLRRRAQEFQQGDEIPVFGKYDRACFPCGQKDLAVTGLAQAEVSYRPGFDVVLGGDPGCQMRGKLRVDPEDQAATTGWSRRLLANRKAAYTSSASRSGISSTIS